MLLLRTLTVMVFSTALLAPGCAGGGVVSPSPSPSSPSPSVTPTPTPDPTPLISVERPADGEIVSVPVVMTGTANTFEAALTVDAVDEAGKRLCVRNIMATSGSGTPGSWETTLAFPPRGTEFPVTLRAYELSANGGSMVNLVERTVRVSAERPPIIISAPACGDRVSPGGMLAVSGTALVFEAALTIELRDASGAVVVRQNVLAANGSEVSPWQAFLTIPAGLTVGVYDLVAFDYSAKDGSIQDEFPVQILVL